MARKHMKSWSTSLAIGELQLKTIASSYVTCDVDGDNTEDNQLGVLVR